MVQFLAHLVYAINIYMWALGNIWNSTSEELGSILPLITYDIGLLGVWHGDGVRLSDSMAIQPVCDTKHCYTDDHVVDRQETAEHLHVLLQFADAESVRCTQRDDCRLPGCLA